MIPKSRANVALALLFGVNFLNYIDRYVIAAVVPLIQKEFHLGDAAAGLIGSMFMIAYVVASPLTGPLGDRWPRRFLISAGVLTWSLATVASGLAGSFRHLLVARSFIGLGEAGFGAVAPTLISDLFPKEKRGRMLSFFYVAIPVGSALGFLLGGWVGTHYGWRQAFFVAGGPGLVLGLAALGMHEPPRGASEGVVHGAARFDRREIGRLVRNRSFVATTLGMAAMTFALGGMAYWMPTFFFRMRGIPLAEANATFGTMTVGSGLLGTFLGGWWGDALLKRTPRAYLLLSGIGMLAAVPVSYVALTAHSRAVFMPCMFLAEVFVFLNTGPANAVLLNVVVPEIRATAIAVSIFVFHLLGDVPSPLFIGRFSEWTGSLQTALLLTSAAMAVSGVLYLWGSRSLGHDTAEVARILAQRERDAVPA
jgi:MFS family permease